MGKEWPYSSPAALGTDLGCSCCCLLICLAHSPLLPSPPQLAVPLKPLKDVSVVLMIKVGWGVRAGTAG